MDFIYLYDMELKTSCNGFKLGREEVEGERQCGQCKEYTI
jgi:hypothetical protein